LLKVSHSSVACVQFHQVLDFKAYSKDDIFHIVGELVGPSIIEKPALEFIASKTSQIRGGDLRFALETVRDAASLCLTSLSEADLNAVSDPDKPPIKMPIVYRIFKAENDRVKDVVNGLPQIGKAMLTVLATLSQEEVHSTTIAMLRNFANTATNEITSTEDFLALLSTLGDTGLIEVPPNLESMSYGEVSKVSIKLGLSLEEVNTVVNDELCKRHRAFAELRDRVRNMRSAFKNQNEQAKWPKSRWKK
jgi:Cdc6-like AAA superfamily ATPase